MNDEWYLADTSHGWLRRILCLQCVIFQFLNSRDIITKLPPKESCFCCALIFPGHFTQTLHSGNLFIPPFTSSHLYKFCLLLTHKRHEALLLIFCDIFSSRAPHFLARLAALAEPAAVMFAPELPEPGIAAVNLKVSSSFSNILSLVLINFNFFMYIYLIINKTKNFVLRQYD